MSVCGPCGACRLHGRQARYKTLSPYVISHAISSSNHLIPCSKPLLQKPNPDFHYHIHNSPSLLPTQQTVDWKNTGISEEHDNFEITFTNPNIWPKVKDIWWIINVQNICEVTLSSVTIYSGEVHILVTILNKGMQQLVWEKYAC